MPDPPILVGHSLGDVGITPATPPKSLLALKKGRVKSDRQARPRLIGDPT
jgi:hypothetical protein